MGANMARLKHIQRRLDNWAIWTMRGASGGLGYATRSVLASEVWSRGSYNGVPIPVHEDEAAETEQAVLFRALPPTGASGRGPAAPSGSSTNS